MTFAAFPALTLREALASARLRVWIFGLPFMLLGCLLYGLALASMLVVSRCREYAADRGAVLLTGAPEQLMSALQKIAGSIARIPSADLRRVERMSAFFVVPTKLRSLTHPPLEKRLERLSALARELGRGDAPPVPLPAAVAGSGSRLLPGLVAFAVAFPLFVALGLLVLH
ncbi:MAG: M48 family metalloprotease [Thermoleophilia bacterium]|nr:M48 family metalloprotease [Thermoleophilia bacterium]